MSLKVIGSRSITIQQIARDFLPISRPYATRACSYGILYRYRDITWTPTSIHYLGRRFIHRNSHAVLHVVLLAHGRTMCIQGGPKK